MKLDQRKALLMCHLGCIFLFEHVCATYRFMFLTQVILQLAVGAPHVETEPKLFAYRFRETTSLDHKHEKVGSFAKADGSGYCGVVLEPAYDQRESRFPIA